jgi:hypothetical protein
VSPEFKTVVRILEECRQQESNGVHFAAGSTQASEIVKIANDRNRPHRLQIGRLVVTPGQYIRRVATL